MSQSPSFLSALLDIFARLFGGSGQSPTPSTPPAQPSTILPENGNLTPMTPRALVIVLNPTVDPSTGKKLIETMGWNH